MQRARGKDEVGVAGGVVEVVDSPVVIRSNKRLSKRMSLRDSMSEGDRQLKRLFRAIQDGDTNLVRKRGREVGEGEREGGGREGGGRERGERDEWEFL